MMLRSFLASALVVVATPADAKPLKMICENPRQEYAIAFDKSARSFRAGETDYRVLAVEDTEEKLIVAGVTVEDGPAFRAHFRPYKKIEFYSGNDLMQADGYR